MSGRNIEAQKKNERDKLFFVYRCWKKQARPYNVTCLVSKNAQLIFKSVGRGVKPAQNAEGM